MSDPSAEPSAALSPVEPSSGEPADTGAGADASSDEMLLDGVRRQDEVALLGLYDRFGVLIYTLACRIVGDRDLAEELAQDVLLRCWHDAEAYDATRGTPLGWLLGMTRIRAIEVLRTRQSGAGPRGETSVSEAAEGATMAGDHGDDDVAVRRMVEEALAELAESQRAAIELAYYGGLTQTEIAGRLGEPLVGVKARLRDGVRRLRRLLASLVDESVVREDGAS